MKVSVCITVFNEERSIGGLLDSLLGQTRKPDEIVIVDGGSQDKTVGIIKDYQKKLRQIRLIIEPGSIAQARNLSIKSARSSLIAQTDAGCVAKKDWLEKLIAPLKQKEIDFVAGFYQMIASSPFGQAIAPFHGIPAKRFDANSFLPSARSMAFKKKVWRRVGGYSEKLDRAGEDTLFVYNVLKKGFKIARVKKAIVYWQLPKTFGQSLRKFYNYAKGDAQAGIWWHSQQRFASHNIKISLIFARYLFALLLLIFSLRFSCLLSGLVVLLILYLLWSIWKMQDVVMDWRAKLWLPTIQITSDLAVMTGFIIGTIEK